MPAKAKRTVVVRRMASAIPPPAPPARKPGERVGLTHGQILAAAKRALATSPGPISVKRVAASLGVAHNSISIRLRRSKTSLERELAKAFLADISRPMLPNENWRDYLRELFRDAIVECEANPGLAHAVTPWLGQSPLLCPEFTERMLHVLAAAGLPQEIYVEQVDVVVAALCGMLTVSFPKVGRDPKGWAATITSGLQAVQSRQHPLLYRTRDAWAAMLRTRVAERIGPIGHRKQSTASSMVDVVIREIEVQVTN